MRISLFTVLIIILFADLSFSQVFQHVDSLCIKVTSYSSTKGIAKQQLLKVYYYNDTASIIFFDKYRVKVVPTEGLSGEKMAAAETLINAKDIKQLPAEYDKYLSAKAGDSLYVLSVLEKYEVERSFKQLKPRVVECVQKCETWLKNKVAKGGDGGGNKRTKVEFIKEGKSHAYYIDGLYSSSQVLGCLFD